MIVPAGGNPTLFGFNGCDDDPKRVQVQIEDVLSIASSIFVQNAQISVTELVPIEGASGSRHFDVEDRRFILGLPFTETA